MSKVGKFLIFCVEIYKNAKKLTGKQVCSLFTKYDIWEYILSGFESLHTAGEKYIIQDIDEFIELRS